MALYPSLCGSFQSTITSPRETNIGFASPSRCDKTVGHKTPITFRAFFFPRPVVVYETSNGCIATLNICVNRTGSVTAPYIKVGGFHINHVALVTVATKGRTRTAVDGDRASPRAGHECAAFACVIRWGVSVRHRFDKPSVSEHDTPQPVGRERRPIRSFVGVLWRLSRSHFVSPSVA